MKQFKKTKRSGDVVFSAKMPDTKKGGFVFVEYFYFAKKEKQNFVWTRKGEKEFHFFNNLQEALNTI